MFIYRVLSAAMDVLEQTLLYYLVFFFSGDHHSYHSPYTDQLFLPLSFVISEDACSFPSCQIVLFIHCGAIVSHRRWKHAGKRHFVSCGLLFFILSSPAANLLLVNVYFQLLVPPTVILKVAKLAYFRFSIFIIFTFYVYYIIIYI